MHVKLVPTDVTDAASLQAACQDCSLAFYLVHSMVSTPGKYADVDRQAAWNMVRAAEHNRMERIIYLGGLGEEAADLSDHLRSRTQVGQILQSGNIPTTILRAAMIIGSGSASFEILRYLVEHLPVMTTPRWVQTLSQPIAIRNVLGYLTGCLESPQTTGQTFDIGGPDILSYRDLMDLYAEEAHLARRIILPVPVLTPRLSSYWIGLVTPVPSAIARPLTEGLKNKTICREDRIRHLIPQELLTCRQAIRLALAEKDLLLEGLSPSPSAGLPTVESRFPGDPPWVGGKLFEDRKRTIVRADTQRAWSVLVSCGGSTGGWLVRRLWQIRGLFAPRTDEAKWQVLRMETGRHLLLQAQMKLPGRAALDYRLIPIDDQHTEIIQTARFLPHGLAGILYWYAVLPVHNIIFRNMLSDLGLRIESSKKISG